MQHKKITYAVLALIFTASISTSCIGDLDVKPSDPNLTQQFNQNGVFAKVYASLALTGQRGPADERDVDGIDEGTSCFVRLIWNLNTLTTDEAICAWGDPSIADINFNQWNALNGQNAGFFARLYTNISFANHFLTETEGLTDERTVRQRAEVRFIRALNWFYLMDFYGDVVFVDRVLNDGSLPERILRADLFNYIIEELTDIEADMFEPRQAPYYRVDKAANWLLKSRIFLNAEVYTGQARWTEAATYAEKVMESAYELAPVYAHLFMADNNGSTVNKAPMEIILPIAADGVKIRNWGSSLFLIASTRVGGMPNSGSTAAWAGNRARASLVSKFFPGEIPDDAFLAPGVTGATDARAIFYVTERTRQISNPDVFVEGYSVIKFNNVRADGGTTSDAQHTDMDVPFLRAAEAYLTYAEAVLRSGAPAGTALAAVNRIRQRANTPEFTTINLDMILDEKMREFYFEGQRRTDLIRFGRFGGGDYNWDWKGGVPQGTRFSAHLNVFPIPAGQLNANRNLRQNPGY